MFCFVFTIGVSSLTASSIVHQVPIYPYVARVLYDDGRLVFNYARRTKIYEFSALQKLRVYLIDFDKIPW